MPADVLLSLSWFLTTVLNDVRLSASPCRGVSTKVLIALEKPELIARASLCAFVLRGVVVISPSLLAYFLAALLGGLTRRLILLVMILALSVTTVTFRLWEGLHREPSLSASSCASSSSE